MSPDPGRVLGAPAISPDGTTVVLTFGSGPKTHLVVRRLDSETFRPVSGTDGARQPFWSPDSRHIGFFAGTTLKRVPLAGGEPVTLCEVGFSRGGAWSTAGTILVGTNYGVGVLRSRRTAVSRFPRPAWTRASARTRTAFRCSCRTANSSSTSRGQSSTRIARSIWRRWTTARPRKRLLVTDGYVAVARDPSTGSHHLLYPKNDTLWAQSFDTARGELSGDPVAISEDVGLFTVSATGTLVSRKTPAEQTQLTWFDRGGKSLGTLGPVGDYWGVQLSPDNTRVAAVIHRALSGYFAIWLIDVARNLATPFSLERERSLAPAWSPDGRAISFASPSRNEQIFSKAADAADPERAVSSPGATIEPLDVSPDGVHLLAAHEENTSNPRQEAGVFDRRERRLASSPWLELQGTLRRILAGRQVGRVSVGRIGRARRSGSPTFPAPNRSIESPSAAAASRGGRRTGQSCSTRPATTCSWPLPWDRISDPCDPFRCSAPVLLRRAMAGTTR